MLRSNRILKGTLLALFALFLYTIHDVFEQRVIEAGQKAPNFSISTESGERISRSGFEGKLLVVNFWATWCPPCVQEMPSLSQFAQSMAPDGVVVLGISIDKNEKAYRRFLEQNRLGFRVARDPEENISSSYGTFMWPETYVINREGTVVQKYVGPRDWNDPKIASSIRALL